MARSAALISLAGMSTKTTSGAKARVLRRTASLAARGSVGSLKTVRATLVPSTKTWSTARWSLSVENTATDNSGIRLYSTAETKPKPCVFTRDYLLASAGFLPSNFFLSRFGTGIAGTGGGWTLGEIQCTVHNTINSELLFWSLLLLK